MTTTDATSSVGLGRKLMRRCLCNQAITAPEKLFPDWLFFFLTKLLFHPKPDTKSLSSPEDEGAKAIETWSISAFAGLKMSCCVPSSEPTFLLGPFLNSLSPLTPTPTPRKAAALTSLLEKHHATK